jgi:hypothetical protein
MLLFKDDYPVFLTQLAYVRILSLPNTMQDDAPALFCLEKLKKFLARLSAPILLKTLKTISLGCFSFASL